jgi:hypothetical protein
MSVYAPSGSGNVHIDVVPGSKGGKRVAGYASGSGSRKGGRSSARKTTTGKTAKVAAPRKGMGFPAAAAAVQNRSGVGKQAASAMVAAASRKASPAAKRANPNLKKVAAPKKAARGRK